MTGLNGKAKPVVTSLSILSARYMRAFLFLGCSTFCAGVCPLSFPAYHSSGTILDLLGPGGRLGLPAMFTYRRLAVAIATAVLAGWRTLTGGLASGSFLSSSFLR